MPVFDSLSYVIPLASYDQFSIKFIIKIWSSYFHGFYNVNLNQTRASTHTIRSDRMTIIFNKNFLLNLLLKYGRCIFVDFIMLIFLHQIGFNKKGRGKKFINEMGKAI